MNAAFAVIALALAAEAPPASSATEAAAPPSTVAAAPAPAATAAPTGTVVVLETTMGDIVLELDGQKAPISTANFLQYARSGHYDGTIFHRVIRGFMIQGGGMNVSMIEKPAKASIKNESGNGLSNVRGSIAMARTSDLNSATSQFYINHADNTNLDSAKYAVFGKVTDGMATVDKIATVSTTSKGGHQNVPVAPVTITKVRIKYDPKAAAPAAEKPAAAKPEKPAPKK
jgi:peptidyl-prolyl cis-trans isomerase A (cyclophilin A)